MARGNMTPTRESDGCNSGQTKDGKHEKEQTDKMAASKANSKMLCCWLLTSRLPRILFGILNVIVAASSWSKRTLSAVTYLLLIKVPSGLIRLPFRICFCALTWPCRCIKERRKKKNADVTGNKGPTPNVANTRLGQQSTSNSPTTSKKPSEDDYSDSKFAASSDTESGVSTFRDFASTSAGPSEVDSPRRRNGNDVTNGKSTSLVRLSENQDSQLVNADVDVTPEDKTTPKEVITEKEITPEEEVTPEEGFIPDAADSGNEFQGLETSMSNRPSTETSTKELNQQSISENENRAEAQPPCKEQPEIETEDQSLDASAVATNLQSQTDEENSAILSPKSILSKSFEIIGRCKNIDQTGHLPMNNGSTKQMVTQENTTVAPSKSLIGDTGKLKTTSAAKKRITEITENFDKINSDEATLSEDKLRLQLQEILNHCEIEFDDTESIPELGNHLKTYFKCFLKEQAKIRSNLTSYLHQFGIEFDEDASILVLCEQLIQTSKPPQEEDNLKKTQLLLREILNHCEIEFDETDSSSELTERLKTNSKCFLKASEEVSIRSTLSNCLRQFEIKLDADSSIFELCEQLIQIPKPAQEASGQDNQSEQVYSLGIASVEELAQLSVKEIRAILTEYSVDYEGCYEKSELVVKITQLWKDLNKNSGEVPEGDRCLICMEARIDCIFLECGHMATCHECGRQIKDCPICRMYIVRVVRAYRS